MAKEKKPDDNLHFGIIPHRPPSDEAVRLATQRYREQEARGELSQLPVKTPSHQRY